MRSYDPDLLRSGPEISLSARALIENFRALLAQLPDHAMLPMVKADAYGHGAEWVSKTLATQFRTDHGRGAKDRLCAFGVATLLEGIQLRQGLKSFPIVVFSGTLPWTDQAGLACEQANLTPVIATYEDWRRFVTRGWVRRLPFHLKFNTGMNRLGIPLSDLGRVASELRRLSARGIHPQGILSHLAVAEEPHSYLGKKQRAGFEAVISECRGFLPSSVRFHLANSAAIWNAKDWQLKGWTNCARPGLSLYGIAPRKVGSRAGLTPVLTLRAPILATQKLRPGDQVGYGGTYKAKKPLTLGILGLGYADGLVRALASRPGQASLQFPRGKAFFVGRISMDLAAVRAAFPIRAGDRAQILGPGTDAWSLAEAAGTIPYELLTSLGARVQRKYV